MMIIKYLSDTHRLILRNKSFSSYKQTSILSIEIFRVFLLDERYYREGKQLQDLETKLKSIF
jgi:hypothetical protein